MTDTHITSSFIRKLGHPIKEIRERNLLTLLSKFNCGIKFDNELARHKELLFYLLRWFQHDDIKYEDLVLDTISKLLMSSNGKSLIEYLGQDVLSSDLENIKPIINPKYHHLLEDIVKIVNSKNNYQYNGIEIPKLDMTLSSMSEYIDKDKHLNTHRDIMKLKNSYERHQNIVSNPRSGPDLDDHQLFDLPSQGVKIYLMPWCQLSESDLKKILLNGDCIKINDSEERAAYFFTSVLLKDFPAEVFLNIPTTISSFQTMIGDKKFAAVSMEALSSFCSSLSLRINQLSDPSLRNHKKTFPSSQKHSATGNGFDTIDEQFEYNNTNMIIINNSISTLKQIPLPLFCLETIYIIINMIGQSASQTTNSNADMFFSMKDMNLAFSLLIKLLTILEKIVTHHLWNVQHNNRFIQEILQKTIALFRSCGDVLNKLRISCHINDDIEPLYRVSYVRLLGFCSSLSRWFKYSPMVPQTFVSSLYSSVGDISIALLYPNLHEALINMMQPQKFDTQSLEDRNKLKMYLNAKDIANSMISAVSILQNYQNKAKSPNIINDIKGSLLSLEFHRNPKILSYVLEIFSLRITKWKLNTEQRNDIKMITLQILAHNCLWVRERFYDEIRMIVRHVLGGVVKSKEEHDPYNETSIKFLLDESILMEICSFGLESDSNQVKICAKEIIQHLIKGKLLMSDTMWTILLEALLPGLPLLHIHAAHEDKFGKSILKTLDLKVGEYMLIPRIDLIKGNIRLLYSKCFTTQMEGSKNLIKILSIEEDADEMLPKGDSLHPDILCSAFRTLSVKNFNVNRPGEDNFYEEGALLQVMSLLKTNAKFTAANKDAFFETQNNFPDIDPTFCRSALTQLAVILQQSNLHETFLKNMGCEMVSHYLRASLTSNEYTTFPESAMSCISILNSLCYNNTAIRQWASEQTSVLLNIIRTILSFPNDENFISTAAQTLALLIFSHFIINSHLNQSNDKGFNANLSLHYSITRKINLPFRCGSHSKNSPHCNENKEDWTMKQPLISRYLRVHWCVTWFGGLKNIVRWPYIPEFPPQDFHPSLMMSNNDLSLMKVTCPIQGCVSALYEVQNATSHKSVNRALDLLTGYVLLINESNQSSEDFYNLPWCASLRRFLITPPASPKDSLLLLNFIKFLLKFLQTFKKEIKKGISIHKHYSTISWIIDTVQETSRGVIKLLKEIDDDFYTSSNLDPFVLKEHIFLLISDSCNLCNYFASLNVEIPDFNVDWANVISHLSDALINLRIQNIGSLAFADQIIKCLTHLTASPQSGLIDGFSKDNHIKLVTSLVNLCNSLYTKKEYHEYKGFSLFLNSMMVISHLLEIALTNVNHIEHHIEIWASDSEDSVLSICLIQYRSYHLALRSLSFKLLSGLATSESIIAYLENKPKGIANKIMAIGIESLTDLAEANLLREQAATLVYNLLATKINLISKNSGVSDVDNITSLYNMDFYNNIVATLTKVCINEKEELDAGDNIPLGYLSNREQYEVAFSKHRINHIPIKLAVTSLPKCSVGLLTNIADVIYNLLLLYNDVPEEMIKSGVLKIIFRCITLKVSTVAEKIKMCTSICRALYRGVDMSNEIHSTLIDTQDCVSALLDLFTFDIANDKTDLLNYMRLWKWSFLLMGSLIRTSYGFKCLWSILSKVNLISFFQCLLMSINNQKHKDIAPPALFCLVNIINSYTSYETDANDINLQNFLDETKINSSIENDKLIHNIHDERTNKMEKHFFSLNLEDEPKDSVFGEIICSYLVKSYKLNNKNSIANRTKELNFDCIASGLCNLLALSHRAKMLAVNKGFVGDIIENLTEIQYALLMSTDQLNIIRQKKKSPIVHYFNWTVLVLCNLISNCDPAKEQSVENNLVVPINKLWPWIISDNMLRFHTIQMLCSYTNSNLKGSQSMCGSVGTRSLLMEVIDLTVKEMNLVSRKHSLVILDGCLQILQNVCPHTHCRTIIVKSDLLSNMNKLHPAITKRQNQWKQVELMWEQFISTLTRYPEGQIKIAEYMGVVCALIHQADGLMLSVLRNCAFHSINRPRFLGSAEVIHLFSNILLSECHSSQKMDVCGALWALCANSHKSKLSVKSTGLTEKLICCLQRLKSSPEDNEREIQIMTYVVDIIRVS